jgi:hypothetical protein
LKVGLGPRKHLSDDAGMNGCRFGMNQSQLGMNGSRRLLFCYSLEWTNSALGLTGAAQAGFLLARERMSGACVGMVVAKAQTAHSLE